MSAAPVSARTPRVVAPPNCVLPRPLAKSHPRRIPSIPSGVSFLIPNLSNKYPTTGMVQASKRVNRENIKAI